MTSPQGFQSVGGHALLGLGKWTSDHGYMSQSCPRSIFVEGNELVKSTGGDIAAIPAGRGNAG